MSEMKNLLGPVKSGSHLNALGKKCQFKVEIRVVESTEKAAAIFRLRGEDGKVDVTAHESKSQTVSLSGTTNLSLAI